MQQIDRRNRLVPLSLSAIQGQYRLLESGGISGRVLNPPAEMSVSSIPGRRGPAARAPREPIALDQRCEEMRGNAKRAPQRA